MLFLLKRRKWQRTCLRRNVVLQEWTCLDWTRLFPAIALVEPFRIRDTFILMFAENNTECPIQELTFVSNVGFAAVVLNINIIVIKRLPFFKAFLVISIAHCTERC